VRGLVEDRFPGSRADHLGDPPDLAGRRGLVAPVDAQAGQARAGQGPAQGGRGPGLAGRGQQPAPVQVPGDLAEGLASEQPASSLADDLGLVLGDRHEVGAVAVGPVAAGVWLAGVAFLGQPGAQPQGDVLRLHAGHADHHAEAELPRRRAGVELLMQADELGAPPLHDLPQPLEVPVRAREPVELPADHTGEQARFQVLQQPLELGPPDLLEGGQVDVLVDVGLGHDQAPALSELPAVGDLAAGRGLLAALVVREPCVDAPGQAQECTGGVHGWSDGTPKGLGLTMSRAVASAPTWPEEGWRRGQGLRHP
jgi:hypothetical protein